VTWVNGDDTPHQFLVEGAGLTEYLLRGQTGTVVVNAPGVALVFGSQALNLGLLII